MMPDAPTSQPPLQQQISGITTTNGSQAAIGNFYGNVSFGNVATDAKATAHADFTGTYSYTSLQPVVGYVPRPELQKQIEERLRNAHTTEEAHASILVLVGLGGAGKSQLARSYIQTYRKEYTAVFWVDARLRDRVERDFKQIYCLLFGGKHDTTSLQTDIDPVVTAVKAWFHERHGRWLYVFDNADSLDDETDPYFIDLQRYLPDAPCVDSIITTRSRTATDMTELEAVEVGKLDQQEAVDIFVRCSKLRNPSRDTLEEAGRIVDELGYLALAVTLAGAYVAATPRMRSNIGEYLSEYRRRRKALLERKATRQIHHYEESVLTTWETSYTAIAKQCPAAARLLGFFAFLDSKDIFVELFRPKIDSIEPHSEDRKDGWRAFLSADIPLEEILDEALEALTMYSLIQWEEEQNGYSMHKLVHTWGFERLGDEEQEQYSSNSLAFLQEAVEEHVFESKEKIRIVPQISSSVARLRERHKMARNMPDGSLDRLWPLAIFVGNTGHYETEFELRSFECSERERLKDKDEARWLLSLSELAVVLWRQGKFEAAEEMQRQALEGREKVLGSCHSDTLTSMHNLASVLQSRGKYEVAEETQRRAMEGRENVLGKEHPDTLMSVDNFALVLRQQGKYEAAEAKSRRAVEGSEKVLGKEHPETLIMVGNLALVLQDQGKYEEAEEMSRRAMRGCEKVFGKEHPLTLTSVGNLASVLQSRGNYDAAEEMQRRAMRGRENVLGLEHPSTLTSVGNLALVLRNQGKRQAAETMQRQAMEGKEKVLGKEHPETLIMVGNLALMLRDQRKYEEAEEMSRRAMRGCEKVLGKKHPHTLKSMSNLAGVLREQSKYEAAEEMECRAMEEREKVLGTEHPDTLASVNNVASLLCRQSQYDAAENMNHRALRGFENVLGKEHPDTLTSVGNLAEVLQAQGKYEAAENMYRRMTDGRDRVLGKEHPDTLTSVGNLAKVLQDRGKYGAAEDMYRRATEGKGRVLGKGHPHTLTSVSNLAHVLRIQGNYEAAEKMMWRAVSELETVLGKEHLDTLNRIHCLAYLVHQKMDYDMARKLYRRAHSGYTKTLGHSHSITVQCLAQMTSIRDSVDNINIDS